jgi:hypothetical protein
MSVLDGYLVDPKVSLLDKTRIQAQVLVPVLRALRAVSAGSPLAACRRLVSGGLRPLLVMCGRGARIGDVLRLVAVMRGVYGALIQLRTPSDVGARGS